MYTRLIFIAVAVLCFPIFLAAHCDTLAGPVITDARAALQKGDVTPVLKWVSKENETEIRDAFNKTMEVRAKGAEAKELADLYFFETLVRIHRMGEGAPYTGLKTADALEPGIEAAEAALKADSADPAAHLLSEKIKSGITERLNRVIAARKNADKSVEEGREYVEAYVQFLHYVERLFNDAETSSAINEHISADAGKTEGHKHTE